MKRFFLNYFSFWPKHEAFSILARDKTILHSPFSSNALLSLSFRAVFLANLGQLELGFFRFQPLLFIRLFLLVTALSVSFIVWDCSLSTFYPIGTVSARSMSFLFVFIDHGWRYPERSLLGSIWKLPPTSSFLSFRSVYYILFWLFSQSYDPFPFRPPGVISRVHNYGSNSDHN